MMRQPLTRQTNQLLGYPDDARLLIINADDFGMCHSINDAIFRALKGGVVRSTTLMVPWPWALHAMTLLGENPAISFGVHLTAICETVNYRWSSLSARDKVPSLLDETGYFFSSERSPNFWLVPKSTRWRWNLGLRSKRYLPRTHPGLEPDGNRVRQTDFDF